VEIRGRIADCLALVRHDRCDINQRLDIDFAGSAAVMTEDVNGICAATTLKPRRSNR
jgi:hypothetical protein